MLVLRPTCRSSPWVYTYAACRDTVRVSEYWRVRLPLSVRGVTQLNCAPSRLRPLASTKRGENDMQERPAPMVTVPPGPAVGHEEYGVPALKGETPLMPRLLCEYWNLYAKG